MTTGHRRQDTGDWRLAMSSSQSPVAGGRWPVAGFLFIQGSSQLTLDPSYARSPDIPVDVATRENASLARLAASLSAPLAKIGITGSMTANLAAFARRLAAPALLGKGPRGYQA